MCVCVAFVVHVICLAQLQLSFYFRRSQIAFFQQQKMKQFLLHLRSPTLILCGIDKRRRAYTRKRGGSDEIRVKEKKVARESNMRNLISVNGVYVRVQYFPYSIHFHQIFNRILEFGFLF